MATIFLPIETKVREFEGKLWLATHMASHGHSVAIGDKSPLRGRLIDELQPDLYVSGDSTDKGIRAELFQRLHEHDCMVVVVEAEGLFQSTDEFKEKRISSRILEYVDHYFAWGPAFKEAVVESKGLSEKHVTVTGNPRFDLLQESLRDIYTDRAKQLRSEFGEYVLVNTNFGRAHYYDNEKRDELLNLREGELEFDQALASEFLDTVEYLGQSMEGSNVVVRPHPVEDHDFYTDRLSDIDSITVKHEGDVRPWIVGARATVQNSCTTGIESALLDVPVFSFEPEIPVGRCYRPQLPNLVSTKVTTKESLGNEIESLAPNASHRLTKSQIAELSRYFANIDEYAAPKIAKVIDALFNDHASSSFPPLPPVRRLKAAIKRTPLAPPLQRLRGIETGVSGPRKQKFPGIAYSEVVAGLERFATGFPNTRFAASRVNYIDDVYWIEAD